MSRNRIAASALLCCAACSGHAATLHGRVKDRECAVLSSITVQIRRSNATQGQAALQTLTTDESGNYAAELSAGTYDVCMQRGTAAAVCSTIDMPAAGDKWVTTQLRDAAPDLSHIGNRAD